MLAQMAAVLVISAIALHHAAKSSSALSLATCKFSQTSFSKPQTTVAHYKKKIYMPIGYKRGISVEMGILIFLRPILPSQRLKRNTSGTFWFSFRLPSLSKSAFLRRLLLYYFIPRLEHTLDHNTPRLI